MMVCLLVVNEALLVELPVGQVLSMGVDCWGMTCFMLLATLLS